MPLRSACLLVMHERHGCLLCNLVQGHPPGELTACLTRVLMRLRPKTCLPDVPADALMTAYLTHLLVRLLTVDLMHMMPNIRSPVMQNSVVSLLAGTDALPDAPEA
eukprot:scaffold111111_cov20-Tisochrysis_lutea.AAC.3